VTGKTTRTWGLLLCLALGAAGGGCRRKAPAPRTVTINSHRWFVDLAVTDEQRYRGLSGRTELGVNVGMLFIYPDDRVLEFCMRGCPIDLDIAFISSRMRVVGVQAMSAEPDRVGRTIYSSRVPARYALEVAAGSLQRAGVRAGDRVTFSANIPTGN